MCCGCFAICVYSITASLSYFRSGCLDLTRQRVDKFTKIFHRLWRHWNYLPAQEYICQLHRKEGELTLRKLTFNGCFSDRAGSSFRPFSSSTDCHCSPFSSQYSTTNCPKSLLNFHMVKLLSLIVPLNHISRKLLSVLLFWRTSPLCHITNSLSGNICSIHQVHRGHQCSKTPMA